MEPRFERDFSAVRVHAGAEAADSARALNARAYTVGRDIVFAEGQFAPHSERGRQLIAHELSHVVQQSGGSQRAGAGPPWPAPEHTAAAAVVQRQPADPADEIQSYVFGGDKRLKTDKDFASRSGREMVAKLHAAGAVTHELRVELNGMLAFFEGDAHAAYAGEVKPTLQLFLMPELEMPAQHARTVFHPGVMHDHKPSGKWATIQADPNSEIGLNTVCRHSDPEGVMLAAGFAGLTDKRIAAEHIQWFYKGGGATYDENTNLRLLLRTDEGVQKKIAKAIPSGQTSGTYTGFVAITQADYADEEFQYAFGQIDRLDFEIDFDAGTVHAWFQDRYEWHPVYPVYEKFDDDYPRPTNCVHAAAVELKAGGARDYWMKGEVTLPLKEIKSPGYRWTDPKPFPDTRGL